LFTSQAQSSVTRLQNSVYAIYLICPSVFHKTIYTLYYASTGVISLVINHESMRSVLLHVTIFSLSGVQLMSKTHASFNMKMQDVVAIPLQTRICRLFGSKISQALAAFIQCLLYSPYYLKTNKEISHTNRSRSFPLKSLPMHKSTWRSIACDAFYHVVK